MSTTKKAAPRLGILMGLALAASASARPAWAQAQSPEAINEAESRFKEGLRRHDAGDEEGARLSFLQAFSVLKRPNILFNLARAEQLTGHPVDAIGHYKLFAADNTVTAVDRETARRHVVELSAIVAHVAIEAPTGADLWIDGQMLPRKAPLSEPADVAAGKHTIQARLADQTKTTTVSCLPGQTTKARIEIEIAGTPVVIVPMPGEPGAPPAPAPAERPFHYETPAAKVVTVVALGVGAAALLGVGIGLEAASSSASSALTADHEQITKAGGNPNTFCTTSPSASPCADELSKASSRTGDANAAAGMFVGTGVLAVAAVATYILWPKKRVEDNTARVVPMVSPGTAGLGLVGSF
jgi:hypothetical protein